MRCYLDEFTEKYVTQKYVGWLNDPVLMKYSEQRHYRHCLRSCTEYVDSFKETSNLLYAVVDSNTHQHVGNINAYIDSFNQTADVGILIAVGGNGYGLCAWSKMLDRLFSADLGIRKVTAGTMTENKAMLRIFEKSGMSHEYTKLRHFCFEQRLIDMKVYFKERIT
jgi:[ribosomal protein S5]-alanine N-acetyltransferase